ncbi:MAG: TMEM175 family protein [Gemmatimonadaceae bacterium]
MSNDRLNAFSDGVIAIIITIMVLELRVPHGSDLSALNEVTPVFLTYILSFVVIGIYWNNHHHMFYLTERVTGGILWANLHLLFWLSLMPFVTGWMGENHFAPIPTALYGFVLMMAGVAYYVLEHTIIRSQGINSRLAEAVGGDLKGKISVILYMVAVPLALIYEFVSYAIYIGVALMWLIPDRRIETLFNRAVEEEQQEQQQQQRKRSRWRSSAPPTA